MTKLYNGRVKGLDELRGLSILWVMMCHSTSLWTWMPTSFNGYGFHGVVLFFIISGYLITRILLEAGKNTNYFSHFYINRIFRIWPFELVLRTQEHLKQKYSVNRLREQVLNILKQAKEIEEHRS